MAADKPNDGPNNEAIRQAQQIEADALLVNTDPVAAARRLAADAQMLSNEDEQTRKAVIAQMRNDNEVAATKNLPDISISLGSPYGPGDPSRANDVTIRAQSKPGVHPDGRIVTASADAYDYRGISVSFGGQKLDDQKQYNSKGN